MQKNVAKRQVSSKMSLSKLTSLGALLALSWLMVSILNGEPILFVLLGGLNLLIVGSARINARKKNQMENEGGIFGFLVLWLLTYFFYPSKEAIIADLSLQLNELMVIYLGIAFLIWFAVSPKKTTQEIILGLSPFLSDFILNFWKISVFFLFLVNLRELRFLNDFAVIIFLVVGFFDLILLYTRKLKINYVDIILNPVKLLTTLLPVGQTLKWILLPLIFIILGQMELDFWTLLLILASLFVGIISILTGFAKLTLSSGVIESRVEEGKTLMPKVIDEVISISSSNNLETFDEFYRVPEETTIQKKNEIVTFHKNDVLLHFPFSNELQSSTGVFIFHLNLNNKKKSTKKRKRVARGRTVNVTIGSKGIKKEVSESAVNFDLRGSTVHRITLKRWNSLKSGLKQITREEFAQYVGFEDVKELDRKLAKAVQGTVKVQEQIRSRIRGVPAPSFKFSDKIISRLSGNSLQVPSELLEELNLDKDQDLELVKGKDEYLFYVRLKK
ncbi:MAG: hypothetical protein ACW97W_00810 [Candidatus Hodarchaeales archaeon]